MNRIRPITNLRRYRVMLNRISRLRDLGDNASQDEMDELEILSIIIEHYENLRFPNETKVEPIESILIAMEEMNLKQKDLIQYIGNKSHVSEVLNGNRKLTVKMIKNLHDGLHIPYECLITGTEGDDE